MTHADDQALTLNEILDLMDALRSAADGDRGALLEILALRAEAARIRMAG